MNQLGLIGKNIAYSFSKKYFEEKFHQLKRDDFQYDIFDIQEMKDIHSLFENPHLLGLNVTIPYKIEIIPFLDELSEEAQSIGAVNTIKICNGKKIGYNTDVFGFEKSLLSVQEKKHRSALILGDGGAAKAVKFVLEKHQIPFETVSRRGALNFENLTKKIVSDHLIIVQSTPVGTFPNTEDCLKFPFDALSENHLVIDLIYNPEQTKFLQNAQQYGAKTMNGKMMLYAQAEKSWEIWTS